MEKEGIGGRLRSARIQAGLTQVQLAKAAKVSQQTITALETGANKTSGDVVNFAAILGVRAEWLANGTGARSASGLDHATAIAELVSRLPADRQAIALRMLQALEDQSPSVDRSNAE
jgi:transcriptional regulator with XRE-family HTH domain